MKNLIVLITGVCVLFISCSDTTDNDLQKTNNEGISLTTLTKRRSSSIKGPTYSLTELIVRYRPNTTSAERAAERAIYSVQQYEPCANCDGSIEKWIFGEGIDLENKLGEISEGSGGPESVIQQVQNEFEFSDDSLVNVLSGGSGIEEYSDKIKSNNSGVTIAVIDSGIDVNYPTLGSEPFLYDASSLGIPHLDSGWNYIDSTPNTYDDYPLVHGTGVSTILKDSMEHLNIPFQLLPLKVADYDGNVSLFDLICSMLFASDKVDIMTISLGWYDLDGPNDLANDIFYTLLKEIERDVVVVTSAGNSNNNNDIDYPHYPSNYDTRNVVAVAALDAEHSAIASYSNYGEQSVDFVSAGTLIPFENSYGLPVSISGTSFATPYVTAMIAKQVYLNPTASPATIINLVDDTSSGFSDTSKPTFYNTFVYPF